MTAVPVPFDPAPVLARWAFLVGALWARARSLAPTVARRASSAVLELAGAAAVVRGLWELAPWLGWTGIGLVLAFAGWMLDEQREAP